MKILTATQFYPPVIGGEERHAHNLSVALTRAGHDVSVATIAVDGNRAIDTQDGMTVHRLASTSRHLPVYSDPSRPFAPPVPDPGLTAQLRRLIRSERPDVVHAHNWIVTSALAGAGRDGPPVVMTLHSYAHRCATSRLMRHGQVCPGPSVRRCVGCSADHFGTLVGPPTAALVAVARPWIERRVAAFVAVSRAVADGNRLSATGRPWHVIPNFVPDDLGVPQRAPAPFVGPHHGRAFALFVGDLTADKGVAVLLDAFAQAQPDLDLVLIGRRFAETPLALRERVHLIESAPHDVVLSAMAAAAFVVVPSVWPDPCPTVVLEAMALGKAVISTAHGGMVDMVQPGVTGLLVAPGSVSDLAGAIRALADHPEVRARLGFAARRAIAPFTASAVASRIVNVYDAVLGHQVSRIAPVLAQDTAVTVAPTYRRRTS